MRPLGVELAAMLAEHGVDTVFGIPGVHNIEMYRGVEEAGLRHILARHEQGAGFMADGYARATGGPGICFVISGPGLTNIMTPMGQAWSDSAPMLVISTVLDETAAKRGQLHQMRDQEGAARTVADWSETARSPEAAYALVQRALGEFSATRPRPKVMHLPIELIRAGALPPQGVPLPVLLPSAPIGLVEEVAARLRDAKRPVFIFGGGARHAAREARAVLNATGAVSFMTYAGRGIIPPSEDRPLVPDTEKLEGIDAPGWRRNLGAMLARPASEQMLSEADLVIAIGTELSETDLWRSRSGAEGHMVRVDIDPSVLLECGPGDLPVLSDATQFLAALRKAVQSYEYSPEWGTAEIAARRTKWRAEIDVERPGIVPVCDALSAALPANTMIFSDMTQFAYAAKEVWEMPAPGLWHHPTGFGTLGYALPAAIGGSLGHNGPVLAIAGDYGFQYTLPEFGTAAELGLSLPILLWDNAALGEIRDNMEAAQIAPVAVHAKNPDWELLARAYGCAYAEPGSLTELCETTNAAFTAGRPTIIRATPDLAT